MTEATMFAATLVGAGDMMNGISRKDASGERYHAHLEPGQRKESPFPDLQDRPGSSSATFLPLQDSFEMDSPVYKNEDDAQSLIQPAMGPAATRLTSIHTPAAEKAAAIDRSGYFDPLDGSPDEPDTGEYEDDPIEVRSTSQPAIVTRSDSMGRRRLTKTNSAAVGQPQNQVVPLPSPWRSSPKQMVEDQKLQNRPSMSLLGGVRQRSFSAGTDALKRIQKALPSLSMPTNFLPSFNTPSFLALSPPSPRQQGQNRPSPQTRNTQASMRAIAIPPRIVGLQQDVIPEETEATRSAVPRPKPQSVASSKRLVMRRSMSDDSLLYHSISRVSSVGDEDKYAKVSEQVNSRFKAIVDSLPERPSFKLPQMPHIVSSPLKRFHATSSTESPGSPPRSSTVYSNPLDRVLENLTGDIVVLGGYRGSVLRSARPPNRQLWVPVKVGLNIRQVNLALPLDDSADTRSEETVIASGMLQNIGPIDISRRLFKKLRDSDNCKNGTLRVWDYGYDWRLSPHVLSKKLQKFLEGLPSNRPGMKDAEGGALVISHSLGGIITRHAVNARPDLFSGAVYAGTPSRCINILGPLRNGDAVLLNEKALTAAVNFSLRTSFIFLPEDGKCFVDKDTGEELAIDFYDAQAWVDNRLSPVVGGLALPAPSKEEPVSPFGNFINLPTSLPRRGRKESDPSKRENSERSVTQRAEAAAGAAPQLDSAGIGKGLESFPAIVSSEGKMREESDEFSYLARILEATKRFRLETQYHPALGAANTYPPMAVLYGRGVPTVYRARVSGRAAIATTEAYEDLAFREGDGVVLTREAMPPVGYGLARGGKISSTKGHLSLLGDLEGVGKAIEAVVTGRRRGIGLGSGALRTSRLG
ncbi:hypothetical protein MKZ38_005403 [Zalerion maritima]|uniref:Uncharacterized protein n=1 Tax=Zalerion maritima TaxID=339359 RepID=A0AAD5WQD9_9PEZI|nr:hypothetical protein MKZ38_005403 [Zalerion maritima]